MKRTFLKTLILFLFISLNAFSQTPQQDIKGSKDHPLITRMPDFFISDYKDTDFESFKFIGADDRAETARNPSHP